MERKKKPCKGTGKFIGQGCGNERYLFGHGLCQPCYQQATYKPMNRTSSGEFKKQKPIKKFKPTIQDEKELKQTDTFRLAYNYWEGKFFIGGNKIALDNLQSWNCMHVLDKNRFPLFKYYYKNVVLGSQDHHDLIDQGTKQGIKHRLLWCKYESQEMWDRYWEYREEMLTEYREWSKENHGVFRLE